MEKEEYWINKQNILIRDATRLFAYFYGIISVVLFPIICMFYDRTEVIATIKEAFSINKWLK